MSTPIISLEGSRPLSPPRAPVSVRVATPGDLPFIDGLQKRHTRQVGWMPRKQLEGKVAAGQVLVGEEVVSGEWLVAREDKEIARTATSASSLLTTNHLPLATSFPQATNHQSLTTFPSPLGYLIAHDQYFKRDDVGIIYQMNVVPGRRRAFVGATLLRAQFERSAYGCRLYCCWCAQDIEANRFWEACGFVPLAFRAGSEKKRRVHIFWSKRIREGDTATPWWFPSETKGGSMMEDRLVFPIPPGTHWGDAKPIVLPRHTREATGAMRIEDVAAAPATATRKTKPSVPAPNKRPPLSGGLKFQGPAPVAPSAKQEKPARPKRAKVRNDPTFVAAARELRDRWLETVNDGESPLESRGKYDVTRAVGGNATADVGDAPRLRRGVPVKLLAAA